MKYNMFYSKYRKERWLQLLLTQHSESIPIGGGKNLKKGLEEYEKNGPKFPSPSIAPVLKPTAEVMEKIGKLKKM